VVSFINGSPATIIPEKAPDTAGPTAVVDGLSDNYTGKISACHPCVTLFAARSKRIAEGSYEQ